MTTPFDNDVDIYAVLGVSRDASPKDIKTAYYRLARLYHPDKHKSSDGDFSEEQFKEINTAYKILMDEDQRAMYDQRGYKGVVDGTSLEDALKDFYKLWHQKFYLCLIGTEVAVVNVDYYLGVRLEWIVASICLVLFLYKVVTPQYRLRAVAILAVIDVLFYYMFSTWTLCTAANGALYAGVLGCVAVVVEQVDVVFLMWFVLMCIDYVRDAPQTWTLLAVNAMVLGLAVVAVICLQVSPFRTAERRRKSYVYNASKYVLNSILQSETSVFLTRSLFVGGVLCTTLPFGVRPFQLIAVLWYRKVDALRGGIAALLVYFLLSDEQLRLYCFFLREIALSSVLSTICLKYIARQWVIVHLVEPLSTAVMRTVALTFTVLPLVNMMIVTFLWRWQPYSLLLNVISVSITISVSARVLGDEFTSLINGEHRLHVLWTVAFVPLLEMEWKTRAAKAAATFGANIEAMDVDVPSTLPTDMLEQLSLVWSTLHATDQLDSLRSDASSSLEAVAPHAQLFWNKCCAKHYGECLAEWTQRTQESVASGKKEQKKQKK